MNWKDFRWFRDWRVPEIIGLVLAIAALWVGIYHLGEINDTLDKVDHVHLELTKQIRKTDDTLIRVRETLSTRYLSNFPAFMPDIVNLVRDARESVVIFCDIPGYGVFSDPANAGLYYDLIEQKRRQQNFRLELTCMDRKSRQAYIQEQFKMYDFEAWMLDPLSRQRLQNFAASRGIDVATLKTPALLVAAILDADDETFRHTFLGKGVQSPSPMPIYFWIADNKTAIFAIPALVPGTIEYGFATSDKELISAFLHMKRRYDEAAAQK